VTGPVLWLPLIPTEPLHPPVAVQALALVDLHIKVALAPATTAAGVAVKVTVGAGRMLTVTTTGAVRPPGPTQASE
jgi:hypothetical protein